MMELHTTGDNLRRTMPLYETERQLNRTTAGSRAVFSSRQQSFSYVINIKHIVHIILRKFVSVPYDIRPFRFIRSQARSKAERENVFDIVIEPLQERITQVAIVSLQSFSYQAMLSKLVRLILAAELLNDITRIMSSSPKQRYSSLNVIGNHLIITGTTKGHGFSGVIKRWNQRRLKETHGVGPVHREVGSMGANSTPSRVLPGKHMPGQYGVEQVTVLNLSVVKVDAEKGVLLIKGAIPGAKNSIVYVRNAVKK